MRNKEIIFLILVILFSFASILPFFKPGFFSMHDDTQVARIAQMAQSLTDGMFPVRWAKDLGYGYGYPVFNFYSPFPFYFGALFALIFSNALLATKITFIFAIIFAGITMYLFVREFFSKIAALVSAIVYVYMPYHAINIYVRGNLNEVFAYAFLPLIFLSFFKLYEEDKRSKFSWIMILAASIALIIISHNLSALMLAFILAVIFVPAVMWRRNKRIFFISILASGVLALGLSAFYWLPVIFEMKYTNVMSQVGGNSDFRNHFLCPSQLWNSLWGYGGSGPGCLDGMSFKLGKANVLFSLFSFAAFLFLITRRKIKEGTFLQIAVFGLALFSAFMTTYLSAFLWESITVLKFLQFPWRFLNFTAFSLSVASGLFVFYLSHIQRKYVSEAVAVLIIVLTIVLNAKLFIPQTYYSNQNNAHYTKWEEIAFTASSLTDEYLPPDFHKKPTSKQELPQQKAEVVQGKATLAVKTHQTGYIDILVHAQEKSVIQLNIAYFPAWKMYLNGQEIKVANSNQLLAAKVPAGDHRIEARFVQTPVEKAGNVISLLSVVGLIGFCVHRQKGISGVNREN